jgi:hypothetical protein
MAYFEITAKLEEVNESNYTIQSTGEIVTKVQLAMVVPGMRDRLTCELPLACPWGAESRPPVRCGQPRPARDPCQHRGQGPRQGCRDRNAVEGAAPGGRGLIR